MPRRSRIDAPRAVHHIICRGIERRAIFEDDHDRDRFVERLATVLYETAPLRAGGGYEIIGTLPYCGHGRLLGKIDSDFQDTEKVLAMFGKSRQEARRRCRAFVAKGQAAGRRPERS